LRTGEPVLRLIRPGTPPEDFPPLEEALDDPNGLLAVGGDLSSARLRAAYRRGIFPWYSGDQPILWWTPDPRAVLFPDQLRVTRSLKKTLRKERYQVTVDRAFARVIEACATTPRPDQDGTWITEEMQRAYLRMHQEGLTHSVETWDQERLVGGLYGMAIGQVFFGESMFSWSSDASKVALVRLRDLGFALIDCQVESDFVCQMGARPISRARFAALLDQHCEHAGPFDSPGDEARS